MLSKLWRCSLPDGERLGNQLDRKFRNSFIWSLGRGRWPVRSLSLFAIGQFVNFNFYSRRHGHQPRAVPVAEHVEQSCNILPDHLCTTWKIVLQHHDGCLKQSHSVFRRSISVERTCIVSAHPRKVSKTFIWCFAGWYSSAGDARTIDSPAWSSWGACKHRHPNIPSYWYWYLCLRVGDRVLNN